MALSAWAPFNLKLKFSYLCRCPNMHFTLQSAQCGCASLHTDSFSSEVVLLPGGCRPREGRYLSRALPQVRAAGQHQQKVAFASRLPGALSSRENLAKKVGWLSPGLPVCVPGEGRWAAQALHSVAFRFVACCFHFFGKICWRSWTR